MYGLRDCVFAVTQCRMSLTSKSPRMVLLIAMDVARQALPAYAHRCSPKKFTQHQLFACLVLKGFCRTDYRGIVAMLREWSDLREVIGLNVVPHFTTLQKAAARLLLRSKANRLLEATLACADERSSSRAVPRRQRPRRARRGARVPLHDPHAEVSLSAFRPPRRSNM